MNVLPDNVLLKVFSWLDAKSLVRLERVSQKWNRLAKLSWTTKATDGLELSAYFKRKGFASMLCKCGPYIEVFRFTPPLHSPPPIWMKLEFQFWLGAVDRFGLSNVKVLHIDNTMDDLRDGDPRITSFLCQFSHLEQLILPSPLTPEGLTFPSSFAFTDYMPNLYALYYHGLLHFRDTAAVMSALALKLKLLHLGAGAFDVPPDCPLLHLSLLTKLEHLSLELKGFRFNSPAIPDAGLIQIARNCLNLESLLIYYPMRVSAATCAAVVARLPRLKVFWNQGRFLVPLINDAGDLTRAEKLLADCWSRKISVASRLPKFPPERNMFHFNFDSASNASYSDAIRQFLEHTESD